MTLTTKETVQYLSSEDSCCYHDWTNDRSLVARYRLVLQQINSATDSATKPHLDIHYLQKYCLQEAVVKSR